MRNIISAFLVLSFIAVFGTILAFGQTPGLRVEANIPFDFTVGDKTFASGSYKLILTRNFSSMYNASLYDSEGRVIFNTTAIRNGSTNRERSDMVFAVSDGGHFLEKLRTPDMGFQFATWKKERLVAESKKTSVPTTASPNF